MIARIAASRNVTIFPPWINKFFFLINTVVLRSYFQEHEYLGKNSLMIAPSCLLSLLSMEK